MSSSTLTQLSSSANSGSEVINIHFDDNRKRQGLTSLNSATDSFEDAAAAVLDKSRKGSIDRRILELVQMINCNNNNSASPSYNTWNYFTTSTCSGRAILFTHDDEEEGESTGNKIHDTESDTSKETPFLPTESNSVSNVQFRKTGQKKGCKWLYVTHDEINLNEFMGCWNGLTENSYAVFKIEPSIFHIQCRSLTSARALVHIGTQAGFRNSGMVLGKDGKITVAIRSTIGLEVPLPIGNTHENQSRPIVSGQFLDYLINTGNQTLQENWKRTEKFAIEFRKSILS